MRIRVTLAISVVLLLAGSVASAAVPASAGPFHRTIRSLNARESSNWSGYNQGSLEFGGKQFNSVSGQWKVPKAKPHAPGEAEYSSAWIGIGGGCVDLDCQVTDATLIQAGTEMDVATDGTASYSAWWEIIPAPSTPIDMAISPGDRMSVSIAEVPAGSEMWTIDVKNLTSGDEFTTSTPYPSSYLTAEWIVETPVVVDDQGHITVGPMPKLAKTTFRKAMVNGTAAHLVADEALQLVDPNTEQVIATPSPPNRKGVMFSDCTYASSCRRG
jgi:hypothetical protein